MKQWMIAMALAGAMCGTANAGFVGVDIEVIHENISYDGPGGSFENRDIVRIYAVLVSSNARVVSWGANGFGNPAMAMAGNGACDRACNQVVGSGFWQADTQPSALPVPDGFLYNADPDAAAFSSYLTIGNEPGYVPKLNPNTGLPYVFDVTFGIPSNLNGVTSINMTSDAVFVQLDAPYGVPDENGRVLLAQFNVAHGEFIVGSVYVSVIASDGSSTTPTSLNVLSPCDGFCCPADLTGDFMVNALDLLALLNDWGACADCPGNLNGDDVVNVTDLLWLLAEWGACP